MDTTKDQHNWTVDLFSGSPVERHQIQIISQKVNLQEDQGDEVRWGYIKEHLKFLLVGQLTEGNK